MRKLTLVCAPGPELSISERSDSLGQRWGDPSSALRAPAGHCCVFVLSVRLLCPSRCAGQSQLAPAKACQRRCLSPALSIQAGAVHADPTHLTATSRQLHGCHPLQPTTVSSCFLKGLAGRCPASPLACSGIPLGQVGSRHISLS